MGNNLTDLLHRRLEDLSSSDLRYLLYEFDRMRAQNPDGIRGCPHHYPEPERYEYWMPQNPAVLEALLRAPDVFQD